ncbi:glycosyltransferase [Sphingobacterium sp. DK4209]|uniref:Glycosyltransferase n=1 Tax=Sphingobacterium zhuxiongii TaxID=2662364 RepID=A0A5Q0QHW9_9SPHI|nr:MULTISPECIES: glycosyltransferase family 2 protein [unclassified Sphingobacterium]MVZ65405.1 glycosyltransferase [Sphingobacterium sp. DK4209]QGA27442.1 glycosyltransferase [Sphingobacterium sp. dk4302]
MKISLIISTYNWPEALDLCLRSVLQQRVLPSEILIADDGSSEQTAAVIDKFQEQFTIPLIHVWQEDQGFQLAKIRNKAIARSSGEYIVQIDGDLILHKDFIKDHLEFAERGSFVRASRIYMNEDLSRALIQNKRVRISPFEKGISNRMSAFRLSFLQQLFANKYKQKGDERWEIHGCNMAYWRDDAIAVNGYNELFKGWGPEDKEFVARLLNKGLKRHFLKFGAIAFHLWHQVNPKENLKNNVCLFEQAKRRKSIYCEFGIDQYLMVST